ncbi:MAG TPA: UDP-N-acetylmuramoyl-L-alanine--D-glutamate ligase [Clostridiaceae bacterium]|nr:UDP-N-acetylmuramoyl-L-alanine--D-glutamate ligase [Clostridiaceae bacterium]
MNNQNYSEFKALIKNKSVAVIGVGISNRPLIRFLHALGAKISAFDRLDSDDAVLMTTKSEFKAQGISLQWHTGEHYLQSLSSGDYDFVFKTPKFRDDSPVLKTLRQKGSILTSEMEVFMTLCPARIIAVTGSDGKTTTTTLISEILKAEGYNVHLGGNIGTPLLDRIETIESSDFVVLELSSFQLMTISQRCNVAVITNISPNHLDFHSDYEEYISSKMNIFRSQTLFDRLVINADNDITKEFIGQQKGSLSCFSLENTLHFENVPSSESVVFLKDNHIFLQTQDQTEVIMNADDILIPGRHNIDNMLAAIGATHPFVRNNAIVQVAKQFPGVEHRIEFVESVNNRRFYNSSIDTSPTRTINTMEALALRSERGVLIAGGQDKKCDYTGLGTAIASVCHSVVLYGDNSDLIRDTVFKECGENLVQISDAANYDEAIRIAYQMSREGDVIILSPTGTSYDYFRHFEERGNLYKDLVRRFAKELQ